MEAKYNLRPLWNELLVIYNTIVEICRHHGLRYYSNGGTMLGAIRHHGFIPWDDDLDLYMPRPDYEKFKAIAQRELQFPYSWHSVETDKNHERLFGKVRMSDSGRIQALIEASGLKLNEGVFVDIFPLDGFPSGKVAYLLFCIMRGLMRRSISGKRWWGPFFGMGHDRQKNKIKFEKWYAHFKYEEHELVSAVSPYDSIKTPSRWVFKRKWFDATSEMAFENHTIPVPVGAHEILTGVFGDYMKLPPEEKRIPSHQIINEECH